ncbi:hypothetical protein SAMN05421753_12635 [Planctomicrobium piriforme]|uniref:Uncharacterized protein n=1 Tax=Planctomicrobium piriforme TaxID=1576369 RepID=A0A1I3T249_9PLAN|nr:hypothetical protein SAMN05421753_12635 [Planctomicrobium piriforme]
MDIMWLLAGTAFFAGCSGLIQLLARLRTED